MLTIAALTYATNSNKKTLSGFNENLQFSYNYTILKSFRPWNE